MALNFKPELLAKVLDESKTVTRRGWPTKYRAGQVVAVTPGMGRVAAGRVRIVDVQASRLALDADEARREGFDSPAEFAAYWERLHGSPPGNDIVARIEFELVEVLRTVCDDCAGVGTIEVEL